MGIIITAVVTESNDPVFIDDAKLDESITEVKLSIISGAYLIDELFKDEYEEIK